MKTFVRSLVAVLLLTGLVGTAVAQHEMFLPKPTSLTYINRIIMGDTLANGQRADSQRVYVLQRGGTWFFDGIITNPGWTVNMKAADTGSVAQPAIYALPASGGTAVPDKLVDVQGNVKMTDLKISGYYDLDTTYLNSYGVVFILSRCATPGYRIEYTGNTMLNCSQSYASAFAACTVIKMVDNVFANNGVPPVNNTGNGRIVDLRNTSIDSMIFVNNTMVFGFDRVLRHLASVGRMQNLIFDHNTVYQNGGRYGLMALGAVGANVKITNNLLVDPMAVGSDTLTARQSDFRECGEFFGDGKVKMSWIYSQLIDTLAGGTTTNWNIANNYWHITPQIQAVYDSCILMGWDPNITAGRTTTDLIKGKLADTMNAFINLPSLAFTNVPAPFAGTVLWQIKPTSVGGTGGASSGGTFVPYDKRLSDYYAETMDCSYSTSSPAYTGATGGFPVGDLNWFPTKKADWISTIGAVETTPGIAETYTLSQNYPNPFNPSTKIEFSLPKQSQVTLKVYNLIGQEVATLVNEVLGAGNHSTSFNALRLASGVYFYTIKAGNFVSTRSMILLK
jgi:hypothetical protein